MPQADFTKNNRQNLKRFVIELENQNDGSIRTYRFRVNPDDYTKEIPHRTAIVKTQSRVVFEDYGSDVKTITFSGQTGLKGRRDLDGKIKNGKDKLDELEKIVLDYGNTAGSGNKSSYEMFFYNLTDDESYKVHIAPQGFKVSRSKDESLLYRYEISLVIIGEAGEPSDDDIVSSNIGNSSHNSQNKTDRYEKDQTQAEIEAKERNNQALDTISNAVDERKSTTTEGVNSLGVDNKGNKIYNPRVSTNGQEGSVDSLALTIGYGLGGF